MEIRRMLIENCDVVCVLMNGSCPGLRRIDNIPEGK